MGLLNSFFKWIKRIWYRPSKGPGEGFSLVKIVANMVDKTQQSEYSCDEVYALLDQYAEMSIRGEDVTQLMPLIKHHLEICKDCSEEYEALMRILSAAPA